MRQEWEKKRRGFEEYEAIRAQFPSDNVSFAEAMAWNDSVLRLSKAGGRPLTDDPIEDKVARIAKLKRALAVFPR